MRAFWGFPRMKAHQAGENNQWIIGTKDAKVSVRLISFCDLESKTEYYLVTNLPESEISDEEVSEIYRKRWAIETLWKFLKMHLIKKLICKNTNGISIQIYSCLIIYLVLQLVEIPPEIGTKALDKLRYLQAFFEDDRKIIRAALK